MTKPIIFALCAQISVVAFGFTEFKETINGIEWRYYKDGGYAVLEDPKMRDDYSRPKSVLNGVLSEFLEIPSVLGGLPVYKIGIAAIQLDAGSPVKTIVIPNSVKSISAFAFLGPYNKTNIEHYNSASHYYDFVFQDITVAGVTNFLFLGDKPTLLYDNGWTYSLYGRGYHCSCSISNYSSDKIAWSVDGTSGWNVGQYWGLGSLLDRYMKEELGAVRIEISPSESIVMNNEKITLSCINTNAKIYYTLDGEEPSTNKSERCFLYEEPFAIQHKVVVKTLGHIAGSPYTIVSSNTYAFGKANVPSITAENNVFNWSGNVVSLSCETEGVEIRYTLDGSEPMEASRLYTGAFTIDDTTTVKAKAFKTDWFESETATETFTREWYTVETPVITPDDTMFENTSQEVSIGCDTDGATIYYTIDGSDPKENGREYKHPFMVYNTCTVRAIAVKDDWKDSVEATATFTRGETLSAAANLYGYTMETGESAWSVDGEVSHDGVSSIRSNGDGSYVQTSVRGAGTLSFWWRAMCEEPDGGEYYDYGVFKVGGTDATYIAGNDTSWISFSTNITTTGKHTLRWEYRKDDEGTYAPDCVWVDQVQWVPEDGSGSTLTTPEPVPYSWFAKYQLGGDSDFETLGNSASGKTQGGHPTCMWEEYVAGTDPTDEDDVLKANISFDEEGKPVISALPKLTDDEIAMRLYRRYGKVTLNDAVWTEIPDGEEDNYNFFKISVEMK